EIVQHKVTGLLVPPNQLDALSEALLTLLQNRDLAEQMGKAGHQRSHTHFSEDRRTERFLELYHRLRAKYDLAWT
ncbi:MAG TPA: glycosyltransferase, partial [Leptolyngbya sp.]|nr:glycosyltransferase [Leptolyngbya sp.]